MKTGSKNKQVSFINKDIRAVAIVAVYTVAFLMGAVLPFIAHASTTTLAPSAAVSFGDWTGHPTDTNAGKLSAVQTNDGDTSYISENSTHDEQLFTFPGMALPTGSVITSVKINAWAKGVGSGSKKFIFITRNGFFTHEIGSDIDAASTYTLYSQTMSNNPATGHAWTLSEVNAWTTSFGVERMNAGGTSVNVTQIYLEVTYTVPNVAPVSQVGTVATNEDTPANSTLVATDADSGPSALTYSIVTSPTHGSITGLPNTTGSYTYTPALNYNGSDSFTFKANDGSADSNISTVTITVTPVNDAPVAQNDSYSTNENTVLTVAATGVLGNDTDAEIDPMTAVIVGQPTNGTVTLNADGSFSYTPAQDYTGPDSFTYSANDGVANSAVATVSISVSTDNAPVAVADTYTTAEDTVLSVPVVTGVLANDSDVDAGTTLTAALVGSATTVNGGTVALAADGGFSYTPAANFIGVDTFTYHANDGTLPSSDVSVTITVTPMNDAPIASAQSLSVAQDAVLNGTVAATDIDSAVLTYATTSNPTNGTLMLDTATGAFVYTPNAGYNGPDSFDFKANDGTTDSNVATISITVNAPVVVPVTPPAPPSGGGGGGNGPIAGSLGGGNAIVPTGQVLGASTTTLPELPAGCSALLHGYMRMGKKNDPAQVKLLQQFLNTQLGLSIPVEGVFGKQTDAAVRQFQKLHEKQVLTPWGITDPTGYVYKTTLRSINLTSCASLDIPMPVLN